VIDTTSKSAWAVTLSMTRYARLSIDQNGCARWPSTFLGAGNPPDSRTVHTVPAAPTVQGFVLWRVRLRFMRAAHPRPGLPYGGAVFLAGHLWRILHEPTEEVANASDLAMRLVVNEDTVNFRRMPRSLATTATSPSTTQ